MPSLLHPVYVHVAPLPPLCLPAQVIRRHGVTLVWVDPDSLRAELAFWTREYLTDSERLTMRMAYGQVLDLTVPPDDALLEGRQGSHDIPPALRLPARRRPAVRLPSMREPGALAAGD